MQQCISYLKENYPKCLKRLDEESLLAASLLHDIGHGPFSHVSEDIPIRHEERAIEIITNSSSDVYKVLIKRAPSLPSKVSALIAKRSRAPLWQKSLISSQLDMDRLDYLRRDSLCSGAEYGNFDWFRIIHTMQLKEKVISRDERTKGQKVIYVVWPDKSKFALEEYIFSRFYMYQSVYFHHTTRGFEGLLKKILQCAQDIAKNNKSFTKALLPPMKMLLGGKEGKDLTKFQKLTDHVLLAQVTTWQNIKNKTLSDLSTRLLHRKGIGWEPITKIGLEITNKTTRVQEYLKKKGLDHNYYFFDDKTRAEAYKPYRSAAEPKDQSSVNSIMLFDPKWLKAGETGFREITQVPGLGRLRAITEADDPSSILRYYFPKEHKSQIKRLLS